MLPPSSMDMKKYGQIVPQTGDCQWPELVFIHFYYHHFFICLVGEAWMVYRWILCNGTESRWWYMPWADTRSLVANSHSYEIMFYMWPSIGYEQTNWIKLPHSPFDHWKGTYSLPNQLGARDLLSPFRRPIQSNGSSSPCHRTMETATLYLQAFLHVNHEIETKTAFVAKKGLIRKSFRCA